MKTPILFVAAAILSPVANCLAIDVVLRYPSPRDVTLRSVSWSGTRFVAAGDGGVILTSSDGVAWQAASAGTADAWTCGAGGNGRTVLGSSSGLFESEDGIHWSSVASPGFGPYSSHALFHAGRFIFSCNGTNDTYWYTVGSEPVTIKAPLPHNTLEGLCAGPAGVVCLSGWPGTLLYSTGSGWTPVAMEPAALEMNRIVWTGVRYVGTSSDTINTSGDGVNWTQRHSSGPQSLNDIVWSGGLAVVVGTGGTILTSTNGASWTARASGTTRDLLDVDWSGSTFVAVGAGGAILTSPDGMAWTKRYEASDQTVTPGSIVWLPTGGYAFSSSGDVLHSTDALTWTKAGTAGPLPPIAQAATNGNKVVVAADGGLWQGSVAGGAWSPLGMSASAVVWDGQRFVASLYAIDGVSCFRAPGAATSIDGVSWTGALPKCPYGLLDPEGVVVDSLIWTGLRYVSRTAFSVDLQSWIPTTGASGNSDHLLWTGSEVIGVGRKGQVRYSATGESWAERTPPFFAATAFRAPPIWTGTRLLACAEGTYSGIYDGTSVGTWSKLLDMPVQSLIWTGTRVAFVSSDAIFTLENLPPPTTWQTWLASRFPGIQDPAVIGANADPDGDGWGNLVEYASGSDPNDAASRPAIQVGYPNGSATFDWTVETGHPGVQVRGQVSDDLLIWDDVTGSIEDSTGSIVKRRFTAPVTEHYFFRLKVTLLGQ